MRFCSLRRHAEDACACLLELLVNVPNPLGLEGAAGRVVFGIEVQNHGLALQIGD
jgi:hypothetical protein